MGVLLGISSMAERKQALKKAWCCACFEAKVKKMCTLSQGLIEKGRNEVLPQLEDAKAEINHLLKVAAVNMHQQGMSPEKIGQELNVPTEKVLNVLRQGPSSVSYTLHCPLREVSSHELPK